MTLCDWEVTPESNARWKVRIMVKIKGVIKYVNIWVVRNSILNYDIYLQTWDCLIST